MLLASLPVGALSCNCSIIVCPQTREAAVIDPGGDSEQILKLCNEGGYTIKYLLHTHAHFDHVLGARQLKEKTGARICLHKEDQWLYDNLGTQGRMFGFQFESALPVDHYFADGEEFQIGNLKTEVLFTPGHTPGSSCFSLTDKDSILFAGDTLFEGSIGRTDLWGGSFETIIKSIKTRLFELDDSTRVITGHGPETTIWSERRHNPFVSD
jgi:hydroxyacylglutathione hydrolase